MFSLGVAKFPDVVFPSLPLYTFSPLPSFNMPLKMPHLLVGVMKMGNIVPKTRTESTSQSFWASVLPLHHIGSPLYPRPPALASAPCLRGQCRVLHYPQHCHYHRRSGWWWNSPIANAFWMGSLAFKQDQSSTITISEDVYQRWAWECYRNTTAVKLVIPTWSLEMKKDRKNTNTGMSA